MKKLIALISSLAILINAGMTTLSANAIIPNDTFDFYTNEYSKEIITYQTSYFETFTPDEGYTIEDLCLYTETDGYSYYLNDKHFSASGTWNNISWTFKDGTLEISGEGDIDTIDVTTSESSMASSDSTHEIYPWTVLWLVTDQIIVNDGITSIPEACFANFKNIGYVSLGDSVENIDKSAFQTFFKNSYDLYLGKNVVFDYSMPLIFGSSTPTIYGYTNSPAYYYAQKYRINFSSIGKAEYDESIDPSIKYELDYTIDESKKKLLVSWENDTQLEDSVRTNDIIYNSIETVEIQDGIKKIASLANLSNIKNIIIPKSVIKIAKLPENVSNITIYGEKGTYAEEFANENNIKFVEVTLDSSLTVVENKINTVSIQDKNSLGDINCDGNITVSDALLLNKYVVGSASISDAGMINADVNNDDVVDSSDSLKILEYLVGSINTL